MIAFYFIAILTLASALMVVLHRNPIYSALGLVNTLFLIAVSFVMLDAELIAMLQVIVYAGAIVILFLFVIMLLNVETEVRTARVSRLGTAGLVLALLLALELGVFALVREPSSGTPELPAGFGSTELLAETLFSDGMLSFELTSLLLLVAVVGAVVMARRKVES
ncbi:MAG: NADH-quinone oxidoreductase subunit J [Deltaproteobacteria bacterium]|nr:NADH-quinone oxidoreductase subunit J [Deltaproteobacteria bacterium]